MAEGNNGNDPGGPTVAAPAADAAPWRKNRRAREESASQGAAPARPRAATNEATNVRRIRAEESPEGLDNVLGYRDDTVVDPAVPVSERPRSHRRKAAEPEPTPTTAAPIIPPDGAIAGLLLGLAEGMFAAAWGPEGRFTPKERAIIEPPLGRIISRMSPGDAAKFASFADPIFLASGLLIYGMRVWTVQQQRVKSTPQPSGPRADVPVVQGVPVAGSVPGQEHQPDEHKSVNGIGTDKAAIASEWGRL